MSEYRPYRQGDDPRQLDWKLLARSDRAYVRLAEDRSLLATWFVLDASASMGWPPESQAKWTVATGLTLSLASVALAAGDPVGVRVAHRAQPVRLVPRSRRDTLREIARTLGQVRPSGDASPASALADIRPGTRVVVVSDFLGDESALRIAAQRLVAARCDLYAIHVVAREELQPSSSPFRAIDPEDDSVVRPFDETMRSTYVSQFAQWREETARAWRRIGAIWTSVPTDEDPALAVRRVVGGESAEIPAGGAAT